jgi:Cupredoxin-like domain
MRLSFVLALLIGNISVTPILADEVTTYETKLDGTVFTPAEIKVPAGKPFILKFLNANAAPAEMESSELNFEKIAAGNTSVVVRVKAMEPGKYLFVDEFQEDIAKGYVVVE